jgi:hypothetical protein
MPLRLQADIPPRPSHLMPTRRATKTVRTRLRLTQIHRASGAISTVRSFALSPCVRRPIDLHTTWEDPHDSMLRRHAGTWQSGMASTIPDQTRHCGLTPWPTNGGTIWSGPSAFSVQWLSGTTGRRCRWAPPSSAACSPPCSWRRDVLFRSTGWSNSCGRVSRRRRRLPTSGRTPVASGPPCTTRPANGWSAGHPATCSAPHRTRWTCCVMSD